MPRPVPAARCYGPHQPTLTAQLEALGYTVSRSPFSYKRRICRDGVDVGHFTAEEAFGLLPRRPVPGISADDALTALTAGFEAALVAA